MTWIGSWRSDRRSHEVASLAVTALLVAVLAAGCASVRVPSAEANRVADLMDVAPGRDVADVGAGDGAWTEDLARRVGPDGHVYATEVEEADLDAIRRLLQREGITNVTSVLGDQGDTGLPDACCDAILLRLVYHHFIDPPKMRASLHRALRPGGLLVVVDFVPKTEIPPVAGTPERGGHGVFVEEVVEEMTSGGFDLVSRHDEWQGHDDRFCLVFRAAEPGASAAGD